MHRVGWSISISGSRRINLDRMIINFGSYLVVKLLNIVLVHKRTTYFFLISVINAWINKEGHQSFTNQ